MQDAYSSQGLGDPPLVEPFWLLGCPHGKLDIFVHISIRQQAVLSLHLSNLPAEKGDFSLRQGRDFGSPDPNLSAGWSELSRKHL